MWASAAYLASAASRGRTTDHTDGADRIASIRVVLLTYRLAERRDAVCCVYAAVWAAAQRSEPGVVSNSPVSSSVFRPERIIIHPPPNITVREGKHPDAEKAPKMQRLPFHLSS